MADRPIIFSAPMIRALLGGTKTQTRRVLKPQPTSPMIAGAGLMGDTWVWRRGDDGSPEGKAPVRFAHGDRLWVRETWTKTQFNKPVYRADACDQTGQRWSSITPGDPDCEVRWRSPIHMPRWASRLTLPVTDVRVQRVQDISDEDAEAEGAACHVCGGAFPSEHDCHCFHRRSAIIDFSTLWNSIYGPDAWDANPWVAALTFTVERRNIDSKGDAA